MDTEIHTRSSLPKEQIEELIRRRDFIGVRRLCEGWESYDLVRMIHELPEELKAVAFRVLPRHQAADIFEKMEFADQERLLHALGRQTVRGILNEMSPDDRTALLEELPSEVSRKLLELLSPEEREIASTLLGYPEDSIGRRMTPDFVGIQASWTVAQALKHIQEVGPLVDNIDVVYVVDDEGNLLDNMPIRQLLIHPPSTLAGNLMAQSLVSLYAGESEESAIHLFQETDLSAMPVTDSEGKMIGIITVDDVLDVAEERSTRDMQVVGGSSELQEPYLELSFWEMFLKRAPWLICLFVGGMLTSNAMAYFETEIEKAAVLIIFLPLIIASGGNSGSQAATLIIRAMAVGEVTLKDWWSVMKREILTGLTLGLVLGLIAIFRVAIGAQLNASFGDFWMLVSWTVAFALVGVVLWGSLIGSMLPLILKRLGVDPATSSAPFVSTFVDVTGIMIYFSVATVILKGTLL